MRRRIARATWDRDRFGRIVCQYAEYSAEDAKKFLKRRIADKAAKRMRKINRKRNKRSATRP